MVTVNAPGVPTVKLELLALVIAGACATTTATLVVLHTEPAQAVTVVVPVVMAEILPELVESLVTVATAVFDELHRADARVCVLVSLNVPVAMSCCAAPATMVGLAGVIVMDTSPAGVNESVS